MEKSTPHSPLAIVKSLVIAGRIRVTSSALASAAVLDLGFSEIVAVVGALTARDFHKSMTTYADHTIWQDVYRPTTAVGEVYVKLTVMDDVLVVSFKEL